MNTPVDNSRFMLYMGLLRTAGYLTRPFGHKGVWHVARVLGRIFDRAYTRVIPVGSNSRIVIHPRDPYWSRLLIPGYRYEPELQEVVRRFRKSTTSGSFAFVDAGANIGFWSIACTDISVGCRWAVAIEPMPATYRLLEHNRRINSRRFETMNKAVYSRTGTTLRISQSGDNHAGACIGPDGYPVDSISIDDVVAKWQLPDSIPILVKLDVEGAEVEALNGMTRTLSGNSVVVYEDHGKDSESRVTKYAIEDLNMDVYFVDGKRNIVPVSAADHASELKQDGKKGYNFVGVPCSASIWNVMRRFD